MSILSSFRCRTLRSTSRPRSTLRSASQTTCARLPTATTTRSPRTRPGRTTIPGGAQRGRSGVIPEGARLPLLATAHTRLGARTHAAPGERRRGRSSLEAARRSPSPSRRWCSWWLRRCWRDSWACTRTSTCRRHLRSSSSPSITWSGCALPSRATCSHRYIYIQVYLYTYIYIYIYI